MKFSFHFFQQKKMVDQNDPKKYKSFCELLKPFEVKMYF